MTVTAALSQNLMVYCFIFIFLMQVELNSSIGDIKSLFHKSCKFYPTWLFVIL